MLSARLWSSRQYTLPSVQQADEGVAAIHQQNVTSNGGDHTPPNRPHKNDDCYKVSFPEALLRSGKRFLSYFSINGWAGEADDGGAMPPVPRRAER